MRRTLKSLNMDFSCGDEGTLLPVRDGYDYEDKEIW
jgi:hypothetical protein